MIVVDANILIRAVLGRRVRQLVETYAARGVRFLAPEIAFEDARKHLPSLLRKRGKPDVDVPASLEYLQHFVASIEPDLYTGYEPRRESDCAAAMRMIGLYWQPPLG
jgi:hypothetical protein